MTNLNLNFAETELFFKFAEPFINRIAIKTAELLKAGQSIQQEPQDDLITPKEACELLKCTSVTLWRYQKKKRVTPYGIAGKKYFKRSEILQSIIKK